MAYISGDLQNLSPEEKKKKLHDLQMQIIIMDSDGRKDKVRKEQLEAEIRELRRKQEMARIEMDEKQKELEKLTWKINENEEEAKRLKKKINLL